MLSLWGFWGPASDVREIMDPIFIVETSGMGASLRFGSRCGADVPSALLPVGSTDRRMGTSAPHQLFVVQPTGLTRMRLEMQGRRI